MQNNKDNISKHEGNKDKKEITYYSMVGVNQNAK